MKLEWNTHRIRANRSEHHVAGRPLLMYTMPQMFGGRDFLQPVDRVDVDACRQYCTARGEYPCDQDVFNISCIMMAENGWNIPTNTAEAATLYTSLRGEILLHL